MKDETPKFRKLKNILFEAVLYIVSRPKHFSLNQRRNLELASNEIQLLTRKQRLRIETYSQKYEKELEFDEEGDEEICETCEDVCECYGGQDFECYCERCLQDDLNICDSEDDDFHSNGDSSNGDS